MDCISSETPSLLSLPKPIRQRIYLLAGLLMDSIIDLNRLMDERRSPIYAQEVEDGLPASVECNPTNTRHLLLTCRLIYTEVSTLVYSSNRFRIRYRDTRSLKALTHLTDSSLTCLTNLIIHLSATSCDSQGWRAHCCRNEPDREPDPCLCDPETHSKYDKSLGTRFEDEAVLSEWQSVAGYLAPRIKASTLNLYLISDVEDIETGRLSLQPLQSLPILADCSIRLNRLHDTNLQLLAVEAATKAKGLLYPPMTERAPFRFLDLPTELRLQILEYTDLVTPSKEVEWNPRDKFHFSYVWYGCPPYWHFRRFNDCLSHNPKGFGCFCQRYHTSSTSNCRCWAPPTPLFLVCKDLQQDAQHIFFSKNHFVLEPTNRYTLPVNTPNRLEALVFFKEVITPTALHSLKSLEIVFPPFHDDYLRPHEPAYQQWLDVVDHMCQLNLPGLSLSVVMADALLDGTLGSDPYEDQFRCEITQEQALVVFQMYSRILTPLSKLRKRGLEAFFATLASPFEWTWRSSRINRSWNDTHKYRLGLKEKNLLYTKGMERRVMGRDYDSSVLQERAHGKSRWLLSKEGWDSERYGIDI